MYPFCNKLGFYRLRLLGPCQTLKLEDHPLSDVRDCLFNMFAATLHTGVSSPIRNLRTQHAVMTGTHLSRGSINTFRRNPKHAVPRKSARCKSVGSMRTDRLDESYVPPSLTNASVTVSRHTTITFISLCCMYFL